MDYQTVELNTLQKSLYFLKRFLEYIPHISPNFSIIRPNNPSQLHILFNHDCFFIEME